MSRAPIDAGVIGELAAPAEIPGGPRFVTASPAPRARIESVDLTRGITMIVMALDHVCDFLAVPANPTNLAATTSALFFTRWITHFCAPVPWVLAQFSAHVRVR